MNPNYWRKALLSAVASFGATAQAINPQTWQDWLHAALVGAGAGALVYYVPNSSKPASPEVTPPGQLER